MLVAAAAGWVLFLRPAALGGTTTYVMVSGVSMEPTFQNGDFVIARRQSNYEIGDVVVYAVPEDDVGGGSLIIHRIIDKGADGFIIQGDNPDIKVPDIWRPSAPEIEGKLWVAVPAVGRYLPLLRSPVILALLSGLFVFWVMFPKKEEEEEARGVQPDAEAVPGEPIGEPPPAQLMGEGATIGRWTTQEMKGSPSANYAPVAAPVEVSGRFEMRKLLGLALVLTVVAALIARRRRSH